GPATVMVLRSESPERSHAARCYVRYNASVGARHPPRLWPVTQTLMAFVDCDLRKARRDWGPFAVDPSMPRRTCNPMLVDSEILGPVRLGGVPGGQFIRSKMSKSSISQTRSAEPFVPRTAAANGVGAD